MKETETVNVIISIEQRAQPSWTLGIALEEMKEYRPWEDNTYKGYQRDVDAFEEFSLHEGFEPTLEKTFLHHVNKWIIKSYETNVSFNTIKRRVASLSSLFSFYQEMGTIRHNPFKAVSIPGGPVGHFSRALELEEIVDVYEAMGQLKNEEGKDVSVTMGVLFNTGLRGHALAKIKVKDVWVDKAVIHYDPGVINSKHVIQFFPIPPRLLEEIQEYIKYFNLQPEDQLLHGLKGLPLRAKQINRLTSRINQVLGWHGEKHVTPHGYRSSIATILDERGMHIDNIKYLLGHAITKDNIRFYLRRDQRKINALRSELTAIENEIYEALEKRQSELEGGTLQLEEANGSSQQLSNPSNQISMNDFVQLMRTNPQLAQKLAEMNMVAM